MKMISDYMPKFLTWGLNFIIALDIPKQKLKSEIEPSYNDIIFMHI